MPFIRVEEKLLPFRLRRSQRARRLQLVIRGDIFEIVAPPSISNHVALQFAWDHRQWMAKQWRQKNDHASFFPSLFLSGMSIPFQGRQLVLQIIKAPHANAYVENEQLILAHPDPSQSHIKKCLKAWYQQKASEQIDACIARFCPRLGCWPKGFQLKQQKTRWGSCGIQQKIYLNWLLILAPSSVLDYVVLHELCHLLHRNHGKRFWAKVATYLPGYAKEETWLRKEGSRLLEVLL